MVYPSLTLSLLPIATGLPMAGIHVRHGDKSLDGFRLHSLSEELRILSSSRDCALKDTQLRCFVPADTSVGGLDVAVQRCKRGQASLLRVGDIDVFNASQALSKNNEN
ncbi:hypothetical protein EON65_53140, partial [archaeon]